MILYVINLMKDINYNSVMGKLRGLKTFFVLLEIITNLIYVCELKYVVSLSSCYRINLFLICCQF